MRGRAALLLMLASVFTLLNSLKPLHIDDTAYYYYASQAAREPLRPYGFQVFWYQEWEPANDVLAPPVLPYWWSLAIRLFGERPFLWKLWLFPFALLFVVSLHALFRRFARGLETPLLWMTVLSPTFLPGFNLMLDVPALALSLFALTLFFRAVSCYSLRAIVLAVLAGLVAGLAMQTKYTGSLAPAIMLLAALFGMTRPHCLTTENGTYMGTLCFPASVQARWHGSKVSPCTSTTPARRSVASLAHRREHGRNRLRILGDFRCLPARRIAFPLSPAQPGSICLGESVPVPSPPDAGWWGRLRSYPTGSGCLAIAALGRCARRRPGQSRLRTGGGRAGKQPCFV